jgi:hypothetical protein
MSLNTHEVNLRAAPAHGDGLVFACPICSRDTIVWGWQERDPTWWGADVLSCAYRECGYAFLAKEKAETA